MNLAIYALIAVITFFSGIFVFVKVFRLGDNEDLGELIPLLVIDTVTSIIWPISLPAYLMIASGFYFIRFLNKDKK